MLFLPALPCGYNPIGPATFIFSSNPAITFPIGMDADHSPLYVPGIEGFSPTRAVLIYSDTFKVGFSPSAYTLDTENR